jgi:hypothetical protein
MKSNKLIYFLTVVNVCIFFSIASFIFYGFSNESTFRKLETQSLSIRAPNLPAYIQMGMIKRDPVMFISDEKGNPRLQLEGGENPSIVLKNKNQKVIAKLSSSKDLDVPVITLNDSKGNRMLQIQGGDNPVISLKDKKNIPRLVMQGGKIPGLFLKNEDDKTIASFTSLQEGCAGLGFARKDGMSSSILKGGENPGLAFFSKNNEPTASIGVMQGVSHLLISGAESDEEVLIHGGKPIGMMVLDEQGQVKIYISKHGVFQGKVKTKEKKVEPKKFFSLKEDILRLFPEGDDNSLSKKIKR